MWWGEKKKQDTHAKSSVLMGSLYNLPCHLIRLWSMVTRLTPYPHLVCPASLLAWNPIFQFFPLSCYGLYCFLPPWIHFANIARDVTRNLTYSGILSPVWFVTCLLLSPALTMYIHTKILHSIFWLYELRSPLSQDHWWIFFFFIDLEYRVCWVEEMDQRIGFLGKWEIKYGFRNLETVEYGNWT